MSHCSLCRSLELIEPRFESKNVEGIELHNAVVKSGVPNYVGCRLPVDSKIDVEFLEKQTEDYADKVVVEFLKFGWPVGVEGPCSPSVTHRNHKDATLFPEQVERYIKKEFTYNAILGPFSSNPFQGDLFLSPLNSVPKKDSLERRVILDLSCPRGNSVNDAVPSDSYLGEPFILKFPSVDSLVLDIKAVGSSCLLYKRDLSRAYRQIPVDPGDWKFVGYSWKSHIFIDKVLPMGLRSACQACQRVTNLISHIFKKRGHSVVNYLDDFAGAAEPSVAGAAFQELGNVLSQVGLVEAQAKAAAPATKMVFLGIELDTVAQTLEVTPDRMAEIREILLEWEKKTVATRKEVQSLIGKLQFAGTCVRPGRIFISRMLNFLREMPERGKVKVPPDFLKDARWWRIYIARYNGVSMMPLANWSAPDCVFSCDACLSGCGGWSGKEYFHALFPPSIIAKDLHINALELLTIVLCIKVWGDSWKSQRILVYCDNEASVTVLNSGKTKDSFLQACVREICFLAACKEFEIKAVHLPGVENTLADLLSRWDLSSKAESEFLSKFSGSQRDIPDSFFSFIHPW